MLSDINPLLIALLIGLAFGWLLHRGKVTNYNVITNLFRFKDFTVLKVMMTAIIIGGIGVLILIDHGAAKYYVKDANLLGVISGAALFGVGMVIYGYCPGTALAAIATGSVHALVGCLGMVAGAIVYALTFDWVKAHVLTVWAMGKVRLPELTGLSDGVLFALLTLCALMLFAVVERKKEA